MNKLFVRLVASSAIAGGMGATALADSAAIGTTGPGSTNTVTSINSNWFNQMVQNRLGLGNWNNQQANTGGVTLAGNTEVFGGASGSGTAFNSNSGENNVDVMNGGGSVAIPFSMVGGSGSGTIFLTGPHSTNLITSVNSNHLNSSTTNDVQTTNQSSQNARSGGVTIADNTIASGGGSGEAANQNSGANTVTISNPSLSFDGLAGGGGDNSATISTTGPGSNNQVRFINDTSANLGTLNQVSAMNANQQSASSGNVRINDNTIAGGGGSGAAFNANSGENNVSLNN